MALEIVNTQEFISNSGTKYKIDLIQEGGTAFNGLDLAADGFTLSTSAGDDNRFEPIIGSSITIPYLIEDATAEAAINDIAINQEKNSYVQVYIWNGSAYVIYWRGIVLQDLATNEDNYYPYQFDLQATDGLGRLRDVDFNDDGTAYTGKVTIKNAIAICLAHTGLTELYGLGDKYISTGIDWIENSAQAGDTLDNSRVNHEVFYKKDEGGFTYMNCHDVLIQLLTAFGARIVQYKGAFLVVSVLRYQATTNQTYYHYNYLPAGIGTTSEKLHLEQIKWKKLSDSIYNLYPALKKVVTSYEFRHSQYGNDTFIPASAPYDYAAIAYIEGGAGQQLAFTTKVTVNYTYTGSTGSPAQFKVRLRLALSVGDKWLTGLNGFRTWTQSATPLYYYFDTTGVSEAFTNSLVFDAGFLAPPHPDEGTLSFGYEYSSLLNFANTTYSLITDASIEVELSATLGFYSANNLLGSGLKVVEAENIIDGQIVESTQIYSTPDLIIGDIVYQHDVGKIEVYDGAAWLNSFSWTNAADSDTLELEQLRANEILSIQRTPRIMFDLNAYIKNATTFAAASSAIALALYNNTSMYAPLRLTFTAGNDAISGTYFEVARVTQDITNTEAFPIQTRYVGSGQNDFNVQIINNQVALSGARKITSLSAAVTGTITSLPIINIADSLLSKGDIITLYDQLTGSYQELTLSSNYTSGDTTLSVTSTALSTGYGVNSVIILTDKRMIRKSANPRLTQQTLTADGSIGAFDVTTLDGSSATVSASLPRAADVINKIYTVRCSDSTNACEVGSVDLVNGLSAVPLFANQVIRLYSDGSTWLIHSVAQHRHLLDVTAYDENTLADDSLSIFNSTTKKWEAVEPDDSPYVPFTVINDAKDFTGFIDGDNIDVAYNHTSRRITLTGDLSYMWRGKKTVLSSPWTSDAHADTEGSWFLYSEDGINFIWTMTTAWDFSDIQVSFVTYRSRAEDSFAIKETHGLMDQESHEEFHSQIGTYRESGGQLTAGTYAFDSDVDADISPGFDAALIKDEDVSTVLPAWIQGTYTVMYVDTGEISVFSTTETLPFLSSATYIYVNDVTTGSLTAGVNNRFYNVYQILMPAASDTDSQKYRMIMVQPQRTHLSLAAAQAEDVRTINLGSLAVLSPEFTIYARITYYTSASFSSTGKVTIPTGGITYNIGNRAGQVSVAGFVSNNHAILSNLTWDSSGHLGTASRVAAFDGSGLAVYLDYANWDTAYNNSIASASFNTTDGVITLTQVDLGTITVDIDGRFINLAEKGAANGVATLDSSGKLPTAQLPTSVLTYQGTWDASSNTPTLADGTGTAGNFYIVSTGGTQDLGSGNITFAAGDWVIYNGSIWEKSSNSSAVVSVNGLTGTVVLTTTNIAEGTNLYYTEGRVSANTDVAANTSARHTHSNKTLLDGIDSTDVSNWDAAYNNTIASASFNISDGVLTLTQVDAGTVTVDLDGRFYLASNPSGFTANLGTVTSVAASVPTGFAISGSPITSSGTLAISFAAGYALPTTAKQTNWDSAYSWGDHATAGYLTAETDPVFGASVAAGIDSTDVSNWDAAYNNSIASAAFNTSNGVITLTQVDAGTITVDIDGRFYLASNPSNFTDNLGTVTSVALSVPTGLAISGSPITTSGTLAISFAAGYAIPTTAKQSNWDTAYGWGDHSAAGYLTTETDPVFTASDAAGITSTDITNWDTAYGWGDHSAAGYLTTETDPVFTASDAAGITSTDITNWDTAYGWGDHSAAGYLTTETDPVFTASDAAGITSTDITNWDTAYGWGDHATAGYLTTETDPVFTASDAAGITSTDITNWDTAYGWGDHATAGYLTTETDPVFTASDAAGITSTDITNWDTAYGWGDHSAAGYLTTETDPVFTASDAAGITSTDITNWDTAYGWGDHSAAGYLTTETDPVFTASDAAGITSTDITNWDTAYGWGDHSAAGYLTTETDPVFTASDAAGITSTDITNWDTAYGWGDHSTAGYLTTETDPVFIASDAAGITSTDITNWDTAYGWGDHATAGYLTSFTELDPVFTASDAFGITSTQITNWDTAYGWGDHATAGYLTSFTELDPVFTASDAFGITSTQITNWDTAYGWGDHATAGYLTSFTELDPVFTASDAFGITSTQITNWDTAYGWGDHATAGYLTSFTELDPVFTASDAFGITSTQITNWDTAYGWGDHATAGYLSGIVSLADGGTGATLTDPNADRILFWDDSAGAMTWLTIGAGLSITGTTLSSSVSATHTFLLDVSRSESADVTTSDFFEFHMPYNFTITSVMASVTERPQGADMIIDILQNTTSIFNTLITIDDTTYSSYVSATPYDIATATLNIDDTIRIDVTQVGSSVRGKALKVYISGYKS
jgi:hypothetical protein